jgi:hypothetical protein
MAVVHYTGVYLSFQMCLLKILNKEVVLKEMLLSLVTSVLKNGLMRLLGEQVPYTRTDLSTITLSHICLSAKGLCSKKLSLDANTVVLDSPDSKTVRK